MPLLLRSEVVGRWRRVAAFLHHLLKCERSRHVEVQSASPSLEDRRKREKALAHTFRRSAFRSIQFRRRSGAALDAVSHPKNRIELWVKCRKGDCLLVYFPIGPLISKGFPGDWRTSDVRKCENPSTTKLGSLCSFATLAVSQVPLIL